MSLYEEKTHIWWVYIILTDKNTLYTGICKNLEKRFSDHLNGKKGAKFFKLAKPVKIVYQEQVADRSLALKKEAAIKKLTREQKLKLIESP